jgi:hypothetical protein
MSIYDLKMFIQKNKHLPNIPSASEVDIEQGYDVVDLQLKSLEKIEELFLYIIDLEKRIAQLEKR